jgi:DNA-directed RNA polymerase subunit RPC12/RpoP
VNQPLLQMDLRLVGGAIVVLAGAVIAIWIIGRRLRAEMGLQGSSGAGAPSAPPGPPSQVVKELQARGLVTPAQLASMTETERQLLFSTMASAISRTADPDERLPGAGTRSVVSLEELPTIYCPLCSYRVEQFTSVPPITGQCETCGAKVVVRRDGARVLLTVLPAGAKQPLRP